MDSTTPREELDRRLSDNQLLTRLIGQAVRSAIVGHKKAGNPIATSHDGKVVWIAPEEIQVDESDLMVAAASSAK